MDYSSSEKYGWEWRRYSDVGESESEGEEEIQFYKEIKAEKEWVNLWGGWKCGWINRKVMLDKVLRCSISVF